LPRKSHAPKHGDPKAAIRTIVHERGIAKRRITKCGKTGRRKSERFDSTDEVGEPYVMRRDPIRAQEIATSRASKLQSLQNFVSQKNEYLQKHPRAKLETALKRVQARAERLSISMWIECASDR